MTRKVLLIGGSGYIGRVLFRRLSALPGMEVTVGDVAAPDFTDRFRALDICDRTLVQSVLADFDLVVNCSGQVTNPIGLCLRLNTAGMTNIAEAAASSGAFLVQLSTVSVFGTVARADENTGWNPESPYATAKSVAEFIISRTMSVSSFVIVRLPNLFGGAQQKGLFAYLRRSAHGDHRLEFNNDGTLERHFLHVEDAADQIAEVAERRLAGTYNLIASDSMTVTGIIGLIEEVVGVRFNTTFQPVPPIENIGVLTADRLRALITTLPKHSIRQYIHSEFL
jgi:nucleoside-diphosphate-sugar epimerase